MRTSPSFETTTRLVARALSLEAKDLEQGLRRAGGSDLDAIVAFRARNFDDSVLWDDAAYLGWRYRFGHPERGLGDLWLLQVNGRLLAIVGTEDLVIRHAGVRHPGMRMMDILVERGLQASGLGVWMNQALFRKAPVVIAVGANESSMGIVRRLFTPLPDMKAWMLPIDIGWKLRKSWGDGTATAAVAAVGNRLLKTGRDLRRPGTEGAWEIRPVERFDASFDALFEPGPGNGISIERGGHYLNTRLFENPRARYEAIALYREGKLAGYVAWRGIAQAAGGTWLHVIDWRVEGPSREEGGLRLLAHVAAVAEREGCDYVLQARQGAGEEALLKRAGFIGPRPGREVVVGVHAGDPRLHAALLGADWALTELDNDVDGT